MVDISEELSTISSGIYGEDIRGAIHDGLQTLAENISGGGGGGSNEIFFDFTQSLTSANSGYSVLPRDSNYTQDSTGFTYTSSVYGAWLTLEPFNFASCEIEVKFTVNNAYNVDRRFLKFNGENKENGFGYLKKTDTTGKLIYYRQSTEYELAEFTLGQDTEFTVKLVVTPNKSTSTETYSPKGDIYVNDELVESDIMIIGGTATAGDMSVLCLGSNYYDYYYSPRDEFRFKSLKYTPIIKEAS